MDDSLFRVPGSQTKLAKLSVLRSQIALPIWEYLFLVMDLYTKAVDCHLMQVIEGDYVTKRKSVSAASEKYLKRLSKL